ncbi:MAG: sigma factor, partial [Clostridia bacterium]|nr:sigma factor [Clostridia bacterium]
MEKPVQEGRCAEASKAERDERFVQAVREHREAMYRVALSMLRSKADAEDAVSEATVQAYAHLNALRSWDAVRAWLMRITVNACHATLR